MRADLAGDHAIVSLQRDANRIHNKGQYGAPRPGGSLRLELVEAAFLAETGRIEVHLDDQRLAWSDVLAYATRVRDGFGIHYLVYRDLRTRGYLLHPALPREAAQGAHFFQWDRGGARSKKPDAWVRAVSERSRFQRAPVHAFARAASEAGAHARLAVVDEESDLTYYELATDPPKGTTPAQGLPSAHGLLLEDRVHVSDPTEAATLHGREFFGHPVGAGLHLSLVEALHLADRGALVCLDAATGRPLGAPGLRRRGRKVEPLLEQRLRVYDDLKRRGLIVKTGFKFGTHFRAYETGPDQAHAPYLIQAVPADYETPWEPIARAVRLSHSVRKRLHLAAPTRDIVEYLAFDRFRP